MAEWVTAMQGAKLINRSPDTIYTWIKRTRQGMAEIPLTIKPSTARGGGWLVLAESLLAVEAESTRCARKGVRGLGSHPEPRKGSGNRPDPDDDACFGSNDSMRRVRADRRRWVKGWVQEGKTLPRVLSIFPDVLHDEIEDYYQAERAIKKAREGGNPQPCKEKPYYSTS